MKQTSLILFVSVTLLVSAGACAQEPDNATHVPYNEIMTVFEHLGNTIDQQVRVVDIGDELNVAVGILRAHLAHKPPMTQDHHPVGNIHDLVQLVTDEHDRKPKRHRLAPMYAMDRATDRARSGIHSVRGLTL